MDMGGHGPPSRHGQRPEFSLLLEKPWRNVVGVLLILLLILILVPILIAHAKPILLQGGAFRRS